MKAITIEARTPGRGDRLARALRRTEIIWLIREFNRAVSRPDGAREARRALERTIEAIGAELSRTEVLSLGAGTARAQPEPRVEARILLELKAVQQLWSATETDTVRAEFAHAMDSLLMYHVRLDHAAGENFNMLGEKCPRGDFLRDTNSLLGATSPAQIRRVGCRTAR